MVIDGIHIPGGVSCMVSCYVLECLYCIVSHKIHSLQILLRFTVCIRKTVSVNLFSNLAQYVCDWKNGQILQGPLEI